ncbi:acyl-CoA dehydrogenase family protein [Nocardia nova]|uniref:acyl-CoA dehydrogenase family protein n=1 Tax=Nocardia nova TaxID=37330 RepID=UPI0009DD78B7|nr:acyl-CoA dehydrogenase family protein [Nocardia nova]
MPSRPPARARSSNANCGRHIGRAHPETSSDSARDAFGEDYILEYPIARLYADARVQRIRAGADEVMKELIARSL